MPFATTYAVFASRRAYDFIHQVIAEENLNVKIAARCPGLTTGYGPSHQATEDLAIFRGMPNLTIVDPCDALDIEQAVPAIAAHNGPGLHAPAARQRAAGARRVRLHVRARQGQAAARRHRRADHLQRLHDDARAGGGRGAARRQRRRRRAARADDQAARRGDDRARGRRAAGGWWSSPRTTRSIGGLGEAVAGALLRDGRHAAASARSRCRTRSSTPARCRRCTTATASRPLP